MDVFMREQQIYDTAIAILNGTREDSSIDISQYEKLAAEYGKLLKQFKQYRNTTGVSERRVRTSNTVEKHEALDNHHYDILTGILNKRYLDENMANILNNMGRTGDTVSVLKADVDSFMKFNDLYGHSAGDACLRSIAEGLKGCLFRGHDFVARFSGEEFVAVMPYTREEGARLVADRMLEKVRLLKLPHSGSSVSEHVTISVGLVTGQKKSSGWTPEDFYRRADEALFLAKNNGRNQYAFLELDDNS
ncbi:MAG: GGDEF domain-containing protein [Defluviitaleaceae bacterium]|nr:GGDEF domain-containing protein [Defluviitaleaceae bacterium]